MAKWISVAEQLPPLPPDLPYCSVCVIACNKGDTKSRPMLYVRTRRSKNNETVYLWRTANNENTYKTPDYWQEMPEPPRRGKKSIE